ncbi:unnamed protein product [Brassica rapa subsp. narinosa]|uniref:(rape) hypothetical protein n=1 Tax=Brassica napus TaxID=3708 RepID=A0A816XTV6_BRANA|nr:unnamed protein product [Brassica napus]
MSKGFFCPCIIVYKLHLLFKTFFLLFVNQENMEKSHGLSMVALIVTFAMIYFVQAQQGFISLDCGLFPDEQYTESATGLQYSEDSNFIQTGKISRIQRSLEENHLKNG